MKVKRVQYPKMFDHMLKVNKRAGAGNFTEVREWLANTWGPEGKDWTIHKIFSSKSGTESIVTLRSEKQITLFLLRWELSNVTVEQANSAIADHWRMVVKNQFW